MYSLPHFGSMIRDEVRMDTYYRALKAVIRPGDVVLDIGAGTGIFALLACQLGAKHVYAVEPNDLVILGKPTSRANGYEDRITFIQDYTTNLTLPERADVIVGDLRGQLPLIDMIMYAFHDAKERLLKPGGRIIPFRDRLYVTFLERPLMYNERVRVPWVDNPYQLDLSAALPIITNTRSERMDDSQAEHMALPPQLWTEIVYGETNEPMIMRTHHWTVETARTLHFVHIWFDADLTPDIGFSNAPGARRARVYGSLTFPLSQPIHVTPGERVELLLRADQVGRSYVYHWKTTVYPVGSDKPRADLHQSTLFAEHMTSLIKRTTHYTPRLNKTGKVNVAILDDMAAGVHSLSALAKRALEKFPDYFQDYDSAFVHVSNLSQLFSE
jgi:predicted RNA methylase